MSFGQINDQRELLKSEIILQKKEENLDRESKEQTGYLIQVFSVRQNTIKNNLILITVLNIGTIIQNIFSVSYFRWYHIEQDIWFNTLYVYDDTKSTTTYETFSYFKNSQSNNGISSFQVDVMEIVGYTCFVLMMISLFAQVYDIFRLRNILKNFSENLKQEIYRIKGHTLYSIIIICKFLALTVYTLPTFFFGEGHFGCCYWLNLGTLICMCLYVAFYKWQKGRYERLLIMQKLLESKLQQESETQIVQNEKNNIF